METRDTTIPLSLSTPLKVPKKLSRKATAGASKLQCEILHHPTMLLSPKGL